MYLRKLNTQDETRKGKGNHFGDTTTTEEKRTKKKVGSDHRLLAIGTSPQEGKNSENRQRILKLAYLSATCPPGLCRIVHFALWAWKLIGLGP